MKIAVIGASGRQGTALVKEALKRGHEVTAIVRDKQKLKIQPTAVIEKDLFGLTLDDLMRFDAVIDAFGVFDKDKLYLHVKATKFLADLLRGTDIRLLIVGAGLHPLHR